MASDEALVVVSESLHALVVIDQHVDALLDVPIGLLEEKAVQLELLEAHPVERVECFDLDVLLSVVHVIHLRVVSCLDELLLCRDVRHVVRDDDLFGRSLQVVVQLLVLSVITKSKALHLILPLFVSASITGAWHVDLLLHCVALVRGHGLVSTVLQVLVHRRRVNVFARFGTTRCIQVDLLLLLHLDLPHQFTVVIEVHRHVQEDLLLFLNLHFLFHLTVVRRHIEVDLVVLLDLHVAHHLAVVVVVHRHIEEVLLLFLDLDGLHASVHVLRERARFWHVVRDLILSLALDLVDDWACEGGRDVQEHLILPRLLEASLTLVACKAIECVRHGDLLGLFRLRGVL